MKNLYPGVCRRDRGQKQLAATSQGVGPTNLSQVVPGSQAWGKIRKYHCLGGAFSVAREEHVRVQILIRRQGELGSLQPEGTDTIKVGLCMPEDCQSGLTIKREVEWARHQSQREEKALQGNPGR